MKVKPPLALQYKKDPTRPGGGVFIARGTTNEAVDKHLPQGTIINEEQESASSPVAMSGAWSTDARAAGSQSQQQQQQVEHYGAFPNMNPALNDNVAVPQGSVQVMNVLDVPANNNSTLEQLMTVDAGYLQGLPVSMLDWGAYFFIRDFPGVEACVEWG